jgi:ribonuclease P protein component
MSCSPVKACYQQNERLKVSYQFKWVYDKGRRYNSPFFTFFAIKNNEPLSRLGVTVTRKTGNAVERNRCKRILREIFRQNKTLLITPYDLVFNVKKAMIEAPFQEIKQEFLRMFKFLLKE